MTRVMFVAADDWQGIYIDGDLVVEGHRIIADTRQMERVFARRIGTRFDVHRVTVRNNAMEFIETVLSLRWYWHVLAFIVCSIGTAIGIALSNAFLYLLVG